MNQDKHALLIKSFDIELNDQERTILDQALSVDIDLRLEKEQITLMRRAFRNAPGPAFRPCFSNRVMGKIRDLKAQAEPDPFFESLKSMFKPIMAFSLILLIGIISYNITSNRDVTLAGLLPSEAMAIEQAFTPTFEQTQE